MTQKLQNVKINLTSSPFLLTALVLTVLKITGVAVIPISWWVIILIGFFPLILSLTFLFGVLLTMVGVFFLVFFLVCMIDLYEKFNK